MFTTSDPEAFGKSNLLGLGAWAGREGRDESYKCIRKGDRKNVEMSVSRKFKRVGFCSPLHELGTVVWAATRMEDIPLSAAVRFGFQSFPNGWVCDGTFGRKSATALRRRSRKACPAQW